MLVLGYSRKMWAEIVFDQKVETWLELHVRAFEALGGAPTVLVPDNLKAAVIRAAFGVSEPTALNRSYRELARHYGCKIDPTPPRSPEKKGKVESGVKYVQPQLRQAARPRRRWTSWHCASRWRRWLARSRTSACTERRAGVPREVFEQEEHEALLGLAPVRFEQVVWHAAQVHRDSHVVFEKRLYSVPWRLIGKKVWVRATPETVAIYADDVRVATHAGEARARGARSTSTCRSTALTCATGAASTGKSGPTRSVERSADTFARSSTPTTCSRSFATCRRW